IDGRVRGGDLQLHHHFQDNGQWQIVHRAALHHRSSLHHRGSLHEGSPDGVTFVLLIRRQPLFYIINVLVPSVLLTLLAVSTFYLPPDAGEKMTLSLFALLTLTVFLLLLADKVPATSLAVPLIGRYLTGALVLLTLSVTLSVGVLNVHHRAPATHTMPQGMRAVSGGIWGGMGAMGPPPRPPFPPSSVLAASAVAFIARSLREQREQDELREQWRFAAMLVDRVFLWVFAALTGGTAIGTALDAALHRPPATALP
ncbi:acetylcholine receptor subunit beta-like, partial [Coturnix japonica]|uniref:acetylcholine receptor subunit beta-like n=1 Tax=Coturnix japonica TaxID=93934 RepID=UPI0013A5CF2D